MRARYVVWSVFVGILGLSAAPAARAERIAAAAGDAWAGADSTCFFRDWSAIKNRNCSGERLWSMGVRTITGSRTFKATGCSNLNTSCAAIRTNSAGWATWWTGQVQLTPGSCSGSSCSCGPAAVTLGTSTVAASEGVLFECNISREGTLTIDFVASVEY